jgi:hypothetical protein
MGVESVIKCCIQTDALKYSCLHYLSTSFGVLRLNVDSDAVAYADNKISKGLNDRLPRGAKKRR